MIHRPSGGTFRRLRIAAAIGIAALVSGCVAYPAYPDYGYPAYGYGYGYGYDYAPAGGYVALGGGWGGWHHDWDHDEGHGGWDHGRH